MIVVVPKLITGTVASPCEPTILLIVTILLFKEVHVTAVVRSCRLPSVNSPVAINCLVSTGLLERTTFHETGATIMDSSAAGVTLSVAMFEVVPKLEAVMLVVPSARDVASPDELIDATVRADESQSTDDVRS